MSNTAINRIDKRLAELDPVSMRAQVLLAVRQFRSSWVELGRLLNQVILGGDYKEWGYEDHEVYCARELGLKMPTVQKLLCSYNYMKSYEPKRLQEFEEATDSFSTPTLPDYQTVELLHKARNNDTLQDDEKNRLHEMAFSGEEDEAYLRKEIRERLKPGSDEMEDASYQRRKELNDILRIARALRQKLIHTHAIPGGIKDRLEQILLELEALD